MLLPQLTLVLLCLLLTNKGCSSTKAKAVPTPAGSDCDEGASEQCAMKQGDFPSPGGAAEAGRALQWGGKAATGKEKEAVGQLRAKAEKLSSKGKNAFLDSVTDTELLRFLRSRSGGVEEAWKMILAHLSWRSSEYGADSAYTQTQFLTSPLRSEMFWMGLNSQGCPTLVVRTQVHDGVYYNEDPHVFGSFLASVLEEGKAKYGVGTERQMCLLMDRAGVVWRNGEKKKEKLDFAVVPNLVELFRHVVTQTLSNYPDLLDSAQIVPASWFFSMCYKVTSRVMDAKSRAKFMMVKEAEISSKLHPLWHPQHLPEHLLGSSATYKSKLDIVYDPSSATFPEKKSRKVWA
ncbi:hypothetical protein B484DRAFT_447495 [Ochromonadaceae sp. CCMP2298]|nr:hypothetical protein B484DRAFT_447495 [Ochromonadaceae sp. CCMP2298]|mmetsp:Transcript_10436/g.22782  ORF Transcript_10436/g.22782 Transcript_10436/m.22782 type:complete len:347 (-) Transcript_10436:141-1181(-)